MLKMLGLGLLTSMLLFGIACSDDDNNNDSSADDRQGFIQDAEDRLNDLRSELEELREDITSSDAGAEVEAQADALESRIGEAEGELDKVRASSDDEWESLKAGVDDAIGDAGNIIDDIGQSLGLD